MTLLKSKPVMTFGNTEIFVVNTFLHVGPELVAQVRTSTSEPVKVASMREDVAVKSDCEDPPVMPWKTYDSYDEICEEEHLEPMVGKVSTLEYFDQVQAWSRNSMGKVSTFDPFENGPLSPCVRKVDTLPVEKVTTFDWLENSLPALPPPSSEETSGACSPASSSPVAMPGSLPRRDHTAPLATTVTGGKEVVRWKVDGRKLQTQEKQILSPAFDLTLPGCDQPQAFRLMILAKETRGKGGRGFQKAKGFGRLFIKCAASSLPEGVAPVSFRVTVGPTSEKDLPPHQFSQQSCCPVQENRESWDLLSMLGSSSRLEVSIQVLC